MAIARKLEIEIFTDLTFEVLENHLSIRLRVHNVRIKYFIAE